MKSMSNPDLLRLYLCPIDPLRDVDNLAATQNILREKSESNVPGAGSLLEDRYGPDVAGIRRRDRCRGPSITCDRRAGPSSELVRCGVQSCLQVTGHRDDPTSIVHI